MESITPLRSFILKNRDNITTASCLLILILGTYFGYMLLTTGKQEVNQVDNSSKVVTQNNVSGSEKPDDIEASKNVVNNYSTAATREVNNMEQAHNSMTKSPGTSYNTNAVADPALELRIINAQKEADEGRATLDAFERCMTALNAKRSVILAPITAQRDQAYQQMIQFQTSIDSRSDITQAQKDRILATEGLALMQKWSSLQSEWIQLYNQAGTC